MNKKKYNLLNLFEAFTYGFLAALVVCYAIYHYWG